MGGIPVAPIWPPRPKRSGLYSFILRMSIYCGHLFFQCNRVCELKDYLNIQKPFFCIIIGSELIGFVRLERGGFWHFKPPLS